MEGPGHALRVLAVDDSETDTVLLVHELERGGFTVQRTRVDTAGAMTTALQTQAFDVVICDYTMPCFSTSGALAVLRACDLDLPFLVVSGTIGEDVAVDSMKAGAHDFIPKGNLVRLVPAVARELREAVMRAERRRAEVALRQSEEDYRTLFNSAGDAMSISALSGRFLDVNDTSCALLGYSRAELLTMMAGDIEEPGAAAGLVARTEDIRRDGSALFDALRVTRDGRRVPCEINARLIRYRGQSAILSIARDLTERRQAEAEREKLREQLLLSDRMVSMGTLAAGVAHEINNPLASMIANLELAEEDATTLAETAQGSAPLKALREELDDAREAGARIRNIVRDLKIFSRSNDEKRSVIDVQRVLESTLRMAWNEIRHRARLARKLEEIPLVEGSDSRLGQVLLNLVINAAQAIPEGHALQNEIRVTTRTSAAGEVVIEIADTGSGMTAETLGRIFTPFFTTKPVGVGTGLGLPICQRIVSELGGSLLVESEVGKGSVFRVVLPAAHLGREEAQQRPTPPKRPAARRGKILVVDDEPMLTKAVERSLAPEHEVVALTRADEALRRIRAGERFDVILCDLMMPEMTGVELHGELHESAPDQAARMVFLTGGAFTPGARAFLDGTPNPWFEKPFDPEQLRALINDLVR